MKASTATRMSANARRANLARAYRAIKTASRLGRNHTYLTYAVQDGALIDHLTRDGYTIQAQPNHSTLYPQQINITISWPKN